MERKKPQQERDEKEKKKTLVKKASESHDQHTKQQNIYEGEFQNTSTGSEK